MFGTQIARTTELSKVDLQPYQHFPFPSTRYSDRSHWLNHRDGKANRRTDCHLRARLQSQWSYWLGSCAWPSQRRDDRQCPDSWSPTDSSSGPPGTAADSSLSEYTQTTPHPKAEKHITHNASTPPKKSLCFWLQLFVSQQKSLKNFAKMLQRAAPQYTVVEVCSPLSTAQMWYN